MINIKELKLDLANNFGNTGLIEISYSNGKPDFVGYIDKMKEDSLDFRMVKHTAMRNEDPYCYIDFDNIKKITIKYNNTTETKTFQ